MMRALTTAGTGMVAQQYNLDVIAHNLANVNTTGFKQQRAEFQDLMYQTFKSSGSTTAGSNKTPESLQVGLGVKYASTGTSLKQGAVTPSGNPTDVAIMGNGFFVVQTPSGPAYTRDGTFKRDGNGQLVTNDGYPVDPAVTIPADAVSVTIAENGTVNVLRQGAAAVEEVGKIQIANFSNPSGLDRIGNNLFLATSASGDANVVEPGSEGSGKLLAGYLESSNVSIVEEMVAMITAQRAYEINSKAIMTADEMLQTLNNLKR